MHYIKPIFNLLALIAVLVVNYLSNALPLNNLTQVDLSNIYPNLFVPAGLTFSIWGIIYLYLSFFVIAHFISVAKQRENARLRFEKLSQPFLLTCLLNIAWIFSWHYQFVSFSVLIMIALLLVLMKAYNVSILSPNHIIKVSFSLYLGWICVALIANVTTYFISVGLKQNEIFFTTLMVAVATLFGVLFIIKYRDSVFAWVISWALAGIALKHYSMPQGVDLLIMISLTLALFLFIFAAINQFKKTFYSVV